MKKLIFNLLAGRLGGFLGRRNIVRIGAFLMRAGMQDMPNQIVASGEILVQNTILNKVTGAESVIIDCGANIGQWSTQLILAARKVNQDIRLKLFCFEPSSYTYVKLTAALEEIGNAPLSVEVIKKALSNKPGCDSLKIVHDGAGTNSLVGVPGCYRSEETVVVTTINEFTIENEIWKIDLLKIDAEGHDFDVILGASELLDERRIGVIQFEYNWRWIYGKHFLQEVFEYLGKRNYSIGKITPEGIQFYEHYDIQLESFIEGNYLACTQKWKNIFKQAPSWLK